MWMKSWQEKQIVILINDASWNQTVDLMNLLSFAISLHLYDCSTTSLVVTLILGASARSENQTLYLLCPGGFLT